MKRSFTSRKLGLELFESRQMLAGNVSVSVTDGGDLLITGDDAANGVQIAQVSNHLGGLVRGSYVISGVTTGFAPTTINGQAAIAVQNVTDDVLVNLGRGGDLFRTKSGFGMHLFAHDLTVNLGEGSNTAVLSNVTVFDDLTVTSGGGVDSVTVAGGTIGIGNDNTDANLTINTGAGVDSISVAFSRVRTDVLIDSGLGTFGDHVSVLNNTIGDDLTIRTHEGGDQVEIGSTIVHDNLVVDTASGGDRLTITQSQADELFALLGSENDSVSLTNVTGRRATLDGGTGVDTLTMSGVDFPELFSPTGF